MIIAIAVTLVLAGLPFALGKYIELNSPGPFDSGAYVYSAKHLLEGARLGVEEQTSARPGTLIVNIIGVKLFGFNDTGPKIVQMMLQLAAGVFMFYTLRRVFGNIAAVVGTTIAAIYLSAPVIAKYGNVKEQFMIAFMLYAGCCFLLYEISQKRYWLLLTGFFAIEPFYFKATGISIVIAIVLYILLKNTFAKRGKLLCLELFLFLAGYAAGLTIPLSLFLWQKQPGRLLQTFPVIALIGGLILTSVLSIVIYTEAHTRKFIRPGALKKVSKKIWLSGLILMAFVFVLSVLIVRLTPGFQQGDIGSYIRRIPLIAVPENIITRLGHQSLNAANLQSGYLTGARTAIDMSELAAKIGRYYMVLKAPIMLALTSLILAIIVWISTLSKKIIPQAIQSKVVWMPAVWWLLDMAFVWVSPRSYEQYYLPLCASAAMLSGYAVWFWIRKAVSSNNKMPWLAAGIIPLIVLTWLTRPIFAGLQYSPDTGAEYGARQRGYAQSLNRVKANYQQPWQAVGEYIRTHSTKDDTIYVWGWVPGIYVRAQRLAPVPAAFESDMHIKPPNQLKGQILSLVQNSKKDPPKFIVDTRKQHVPWDRPPLELWPHTYSQEQPTGNPIPNDPAFIEQYDRLYKKLLAEKFDPRQPEYKNLPGLTVWLNTAPWSKAMPDEAQRYEAMKPFREFVMSNYRIVGHFGAQVLFELK